MNEILLKIRQAISNYVIKYDRYPDTIIINEYDLNVLKYNSSPFMVYKKLEKEIICEVVGLKVIPIKYGELQVVEVFL